MKWDQFVFSTLFSLFRGAYPLDSPEFSGKLLFTMKTLNCNSNLTFIWWGDWLESEEGTLAIVYFALQASALSLLGHLGSSRTGLPTAVCADQVQVSSVTHQSLEYISWFCNIFHSLTFWEFWLSVLKANSDLMQLSNLGSDCWESTGWHRFWGSKILASLCFGVALESSFPSYMVDLSVPGHVLCWSWVWPTGSSFQLDLGLGIS